MMDSGRDSRDVRWQRSKREVGHRGGQTQGRQNLQSRDIFTENVAAETFNSGAGDEEKTAELCKRWRIVKMAGGRAGR